VPDIIVRKVRDDWAVMLNPDIVPRVRLNRMYADLFRSNRDSSHADLAAQLQEARWTVRNVEQRFSTILRVGQAIVKRQRNFLDYGELAMKPLGLREIAEELELHESTVSRVTNNKYMATPLGVFELKFFFSRALATSSGGTCSTTAIRGAIKEMIEEEDAAHPLSDAHIARLLSRQGLKVARRTVTKYRQMMKVPPYEARRRGVQ
jgi:RNA polymerase sigma-54 factor